MMMGGSPGGPSARWATVFLDTSLGTHLAVSCAPRSTALHFKGQVGVEHALCFPHMGDITVKSLMFRRKGIWYHLANSLILEDVFCRVKGSWFLRVDAVSQAAVGHKDADSGTKAKQMHDALLSEQNARHLAGECRQNMMLFVKDVLPEQVDLSLRDPPLQQDRKCEEPRESEQLVNVVGRTEVAVCSSQHEISKVQATTVDDAQTQDKEVTALETREAVKPAKPTDKVNLLIALHNHEANSVTNQTEPKAGTSDLGCFVEKNDSTSAAEKHADEEHLPGKLVTQQDHLKCDAPTCSRSHDISKVQAIVEDAPNQDEGVTARENKGMVKSTKSTDKVDLLALSHYLEVTSMTNGTKSNAGTSALGGLVDKNNSNFSVDKHANEESLQESLVKQQEYLKNDAAMCCPKNEISQVQDTVKDTQSLDEGAVVLENKELVKSTKSTDEVHLLAVSHNQVVNSLANEAESNARTSALGCLVNVNDCICVSSEKHADEERSQEKVDKQQKSLNSDAKNSQLNDGSTSSRKAGSSGTRHKHNSGGPSDARATYSADIQSEGPSGSFGFKSCKKSKVEPLACQGNNNTTVFPEVEVTNFNIGRASGENLRYSIKNFDPFTAKQCADTAAVGDSASALTVTKSLKKKRSRNEHADQKSKPLPHELADHAYCTEERSSHHRKGSFTADVCNEKSGKCELYCMEKGAPQKTNKQGLLEDSADPALCVQSKKRFNSLEKEATACNSKKQKKRKFVCPRKDGTLETTKGTDCLQTDQRKSNVLETKEGQRNLEKSCQSAEKCPSETGTTRVPLDDPTKKSAPLQVAFFNISDTESGSNSNDRPQRRMKHEMATSTDSTEWESGCQRRRQRVGVRKVPFSRLRKMY